MYRKHNKLIIMELQKSRNIRDKLILLKGEVFKGRAGWNNWVNEKFQKNPLNVKLE